MQRFCFSPLTSRAFNEVAMQMSASALRVVGCGSSSSADDNSNHFTYKWTCRDKCVHYVALVMTVGHRICYGWDQPLKDTQDCRFSPPIVHLEADCGSRFTCRSSHRRSLKSSRPSVRCYMGKQQDEGGSTEQGFSLSSFIKRNPKYLKFSRNLHT